MGTTNIGISKEADPKLYDLLGQYFYSPNSYLENQIVSAIYQNIGIERVTAPKVNDDVEPTIK